ncbi:hypothetical protein LUZ60_014201 [Juncus effusus]|nr:hypothetical protein LUZ60_014201 [Juncus effusus]
MGAPKQKWTSEEETALKAGIAKHGAGKWRTILRDPEFSAVLSLRSNVDLKDKWRNMNVLATGSGSRERVRMPANKKSRPNNPRNEDADLDDELALTGDLAVADLDGNEILDAVPLAMSASEPQQTLQISQSAKISASKLGNIVMEAIRALKEPSGSHKTAIAEYIEDQYWVPADFKELLSAKLKDLSSSGKLIRVKRKYRIAPHPFYPKQPKTPMLLLEGQSQSQSTHHHHPYPSSSADEKVKVKVLTRADVDAELARMRGMTAEQAAEVAARAVEEAEVIMAEAELAARDAELAEQEAEAAQAFAEAAGLNLKNRQATKLTIRAS